ncbi:MAG: peptide transporter [Planctomycetes bacterium]|jgi:putative OPT family oligopeptide transporter|nr:peptide transporter [Planctomycetota bacterium]MDP6409666.1 OPT/YSL family transporter [Planctomycetota bacterium]
MHPPRRSWTSGIFQRRYREITPEAIGFGILIGVVMNAAITYSGLKIGFTIGGSAIAAVLGWGVLRGILRKGSIVENNVAQTVASSVNTSNSGVIFTVPVLFLLGVRIDFWWLTAACTAGAILGVAFIIPTRKQMIDCDRLRFPTGTAVAAVLRSPGEGVEKALVLMGGIGLAMAVFFFTQSHAVLGIPGYAQLGIPGVGEDVLDVGMWIASLPGVGGLWHDSFQFTWAIAPFALGAGFITGRPGLVVLAGGLLAAYVITPVAFDNQWMPAGVEADGAAGWALLNMNRPLGIGLLMGGALVGLLFAIPAIGAALKSMRGAGESGRERDELPLGVLAVAVVGAFCVLFGAAHATVSGGSLGQAALIAAVGTAWMWFAGIVIAQCAGMTDWSPISGMALLTVMVCLLLTDNQVVPAVLIGAAVCVAITECADMMQDLKTGHMVGGSPLRQQFMELCVVWIGPVVCLATVYLLAERNLGEYGVAFGPGTDSPAPQAAALQGAIDTIRSDNAPTGLYAMGGVLGGLMSFSGIPGLGVLVGLSMYLPLRYLLPYGLGCAVQMLLSRLKGANWTERWGTPFAAGLLVGEGLLGIVFAAIQVLRG